MLITANTPPEYVAGAMGALQSSVYISNAVGPLIGGVLASTVGYRVTFLITAVLYVASALPVFPLAAIGAVGMFIVCVGAVRGGVPAAIAPRSQEQMA